MSSTPVPEATPARLWLAWGVHIFTALGAVLGVAAVVSIANGDFSEAALLILVALFIDAVDGSMARAVGVAELLPDFDGRRLDDMVDFFNYVLVPTVFMIAAGSLLHGALVAFPILASAYGFSQTAAKTEDDFFLGFPSYWNVIALYLWLLEIGPGLGSAIVIGFSVLVFVPIKYIYPSKLTVLFRTTLVSSGLWLAVMALCAVDPQQAAKFRLIEISLLYPAYYIGLSLVIGGWHRRD
jgi:phosphatidylcholine synthase